MSEDDNVQTRSAILKMSRLSNLAANYGGTGHRSTLASATEPHGMSKPKSSDLRLCGPVRDAAIAHFTNRVETFPSPAATGPPSIFHQQPTIAEEAFWPQFRLLLLSGNDSKGHRRRKGQLPETYN